MLQTATRAWALTPASTPSRTTAGTHAHTSRSSKAAVRDLLSVAFAYRQEENRATIIMLAVLPVRDATGCLGRSETRGVRQFDV
jgi:hypothetical protein